MRPLVPYQVPSLLLSVPSSPVSASAMGRTTSDVILLKAAPQRAAAINGSQCNRSVISIARIIDVDCHHKAESYPPRLSVPRDSLRCEWGPIPSDSCIPLRLSHSGDLVGGHHSFSLDLPFFLVRGDPSLRGRTEEGARMYGDLCGGERFRRA